MPTLEDARTWYDPKDPIHGFSHIERVFLLAERLAESEDADIKIVRAAALLHDAVGHKNQETRMDHEDAAAIFAREILEREAWGDIQIKAVQHCIRTHRFRNQTKQPKTIEAKVLFDADKLDAIGAIGAVRAISYAVLAEQDLYSRPSQNFLEYGEKEHGEPHTPYHEFLFKLVKLKDQMMTRSGRELAEGRHTFLALFFDQFNAEICLAR